MPARNELDTENRHNWWLLPGRFIRSTLDSVTGPANPGERGPTKAPTPRQKEVVEVPISLGPSPQIMF